LRRRVIGPDGKRQQAGGQNSKGEWAFHVRNL
jgi:hypothetical protein